MLRRLPFILVACVAALFLAGAVTVVCLSYPATPAILTANPGLWVPLVFVVFLMVLSASFSIYGSVNARRKKN